MGILLLLADLLLGTSTLGVLLEGTEELVDEGIVTEEGGLTVEF